jgi:hypothetical protein
MSRGPGLVEARIADLLAETRDQALSVEDLADNAYGLKGARPTRKQRLSATRAAHRLLRRAEEARNRASELRDKARVNAEAALGRPERIMRWAYDEEFHAVYESDLAYVKAEKLSVVYSRLGFWDATTLKGRLYLHPPGVPLQIWAVTIDRSGVHWFDAEIVRITERNVMARYAGEVARLDRFRLLLAWAWWRGVRFVASRTGRIAAELEAAWWERYGQASGGVPPSMQMPLEEARLLLGVPVNYTREDVISAFRRAAKKAHPDAGGAPEMFQKLVEARDRLLKSLGTRPSKPPQYAPSGTTFVWRSGGSRRPSIGSTRRLARGDNA